MQPYAIAGVVNLSDMMTYLGITDPDEREEFTDYISSVTWGDANYTLISAIRFHDVFIMGSPVKRIAAEWSQWTVFGETMDRMGVHYINLEQ